jgi:hypothetical protein
VGRARQLAQHFLRLVRERCGRELDEWVADVHDTGPPELRGLSRNPRRDWDAVHAGPTERWSSGSVGQVGIHHLADGALRRAIHG